MNILMSLPHERWHPNTQFSIQALINLNLLLRLKERVSLISPRLILWLKVSFSAYKIWLADFAISQKHLPSLNHKTDDSLSKGKFYYGWKCETPLLFMLSHQAWSLLCLKASVTKCPENFCLLSLVLKLQDNRCWKESAAWEQLWNFTITLQNKRGDWNSPS